jgi:hypothetical protein
MAVILYAPFWAGRDTLESLIHQTENMITSTPVLVQVIAQRYFDISITAGEAQRLPRLAFLMLYLPLAWQARRSFDHLVVMSFTVLFLYLLVAAAWFRPWYMLWPATLAALRPRGWLGATFLAITLAASFPDVVEQFRGFWSFLATYERAIAAPILLAFLPPAVVWLLGVMRQRSWSLGAQPDTARTFASARMAAQDASTRTP